MEEFQIQGVLAPVFTPIDEDGHINFTVIPSYIQYLHSAKIQGILVGGTTGEAALLNLKERKQLLKTWIQAAKPLNIRVISQVGGAPLPDVIELATYSEAVGADAIMTLPELYYKPKTVEQLVRYLEIVSKAAPSLPLIYYHFPMMSGVDVNMKQLFEIAHRRLRNFKGMKADLNVAVQVTDQLAADQKVFIANHHIASSAVMGHDSSIATVTNMFPSLVLSIVEAMKNGDVIAARDSQIELNRVVDAINCQGDFVPAMKAAMEIVTGVKVGPPRQPLIALNEAQRAHITEVLRAYKL